MSRLQKEPLVLERRATGEDSLENNEAQCIDDVRRTEDDGNQESQMPRPSFLAALLRALSAWSV